MEKQHECVTYAPSSSEAVDIANNPVTAMQMRPHHYSGDYKLFFDRALLGEGLYPFPVDTFISRFNTSNQFAGDYVRDVLGENLNSQKMPWAINFICMKLSRLTDDEWIEFSGTPDRMCDSCEIGRHCTAINAHGGELIKHDERSYLSEIHQFFREYFPNWKKISSHEKRQSLIRTKKTITLDDYAGSRLRDGIFTKVQDEIPVYLVNVGALRTALREERWRIKQL